MGGFRILSRNLARQLTTEEATGVSGGFGEEPGCGPTTTTCMVVGPALCHLVIDDGCPGDIA
jgi:hypothetical protein